MIIWVFFQGGVGGDGVANLLEHASNAVSIDRKVTWRIHRYVDSKVKFWAPNLPGITDRNNTFNQLNTEHLEIAHSDDQYLVVTSHDIRFNNVFQNNNIPEEKNIKLLLTANNFINRQINFNIKNLNEFKHDQLMQDKQVIHGVMDFVLNVDTMQLGDWKYTKKIIDQIGLTLDQTDFEHYNKIVSGELAYENLGIERYKSYISNDGITKYIKIN
jgi:hypothetical protein